LIEIFLRLSPSALISSIDDQPQSLEPLLSESFLFILLTFSLIHTFTLSLIVGHHHPRKILS